MAILKIAKLGHPILVKKTNEINNLDDINLKNIVLNMSETMLDADGIGLAAPQVHLSHRMFIYRNPDVEIDEKINISVLINPKIEKVSNETEDDWEGCLSVPGLRGLVPRHRKIRYKGLNEKGKKIDKIVEGLHARVVQHECDHLEGIIYVQRMDNLEDLVFESEMKFYNKF